MADQQNKQKERKKKKKSHTQKEKCATEATRCARWRSHAEIDGQSKTNRTKTNYCLTHKPHGVIIYCLFSEYRTGTAVETAQHTRPR